MTTTDMDSQASEPTSPSARPTRVGDEPFEAEFVGVHRPRRRRLLAAVGVAFAVYLIFVGPPSGREIVLMWMLLWLFAAVGGSRALFVRVVTKDWLPLFVVLFAYDFLRGQVERMPWSRSLTLLRDDSLVLRAWHAHVQPQLAGDQQLFGVLPTVWLQQRLHPTGNFHWYDVALSVVYMSHFVLPLGLALLLWSRSYQAFQRYVAVFTTLSAMGLATYLLFPAAPPWMASLNGYAPHGIDRIMGETLKAIGSTPARSLIERGENWSNPVAAMPSLHAAMPMMILLFFWGTARWWLRAVMVAYTLAMAFALVYGGEHYVVDIVAGWAYAALAWLVVTQVARRRRERLLREVEPYPTPYSPHHEPAVSA